MTTRSLLDEALAALGRAWLLTALRGKVPDLIDAWQRQPPADEATVRKWIASGFNIGLRTGATYREGTEDGPVRPCSGIVVIDEDRAKGGNIEAALGYVPRTPTVETGGGGRHFYFLAPDEPLGNSVGKLAPKIDVRGEGGQVVFVGSIHPQTGKPYVWAEGLSPEDLPFAPFPPEALEKLVRRRAQVPREASPKAAPTCGVTRYAQAALEREVQAVRGAPEGERNDQLNRSAFALGQLVGGGQIDRALVERELTSAAYACGLDRDPGCGPHGIAATICSGLERGAEQPRYRSPQRPHARKEARASDPSDTDEHTLPEILIPGGHIDDTRAYIEIGNDDFVDGVLRAIPGGVLYRRGDLAGELVGLPGKRRFRPLSISRLRVLVDQYVRLVRWHKKATDPEPKKQYVNCSKDHGSILVDTAGIHPSIRDLRFLVAYPCFLGADFELADPGWNERYSLYYDEPPALQNLEINYTDEEAHETLDQLVTDFPFKDTASQQNFYGLLLTPILRPAVGGNSPMHMLLSPLERIGKTKLAEQVLGGIILGRPTPAMQLTGNEEERDKRILAILLRGDTIVHLDNVREYLDSAALPSLLTAGFYAGRPLGESKIVELANNTTIIASGNNVRATGELVKRTVPIQLQPRDDHPEDRCDFKHPDLPAYVHEVRRRVLGVLISMVIRWRDGSRELSTDTMGGFERWSQVVGGVLQANFLFKWRKNVRAWARQADPHGEDQRAFVDAWAKRVPIGEKRSSSQLLAIADEIGAFQLRGDSPRARATSFSMSVLLKVVDKPVGGYIIRATGSGGTSLYFLEEL